MMCIKTFVTAFAIVALGFQCAHLAFYFTAHVDGELCIAAATGEGATPLPPGYLEGCMPVVNADGSPKAYEVAIGKDSKDAVTMLEVDTPPATGILTALVWTAIGLVVAVVSAALHVLQCRGRARCLLVLAVINFLCVCAAFSYLATSRYSLAAGATSVEFALTPSFTWGPGMNLGAALSLLVLIALDAFGVKTTPAPANVDIEAGTAKPKPRAAKPKGQPKAAPAPAPAPAAAAKKPPRKYNAEPASAA